MANAIVAMVGNANGDSKKETITDAINKLCGEQDLEQELSRSQHYMVIKSDLEAMGYKLYIHKTATGIRLEYYQAEDFRTPKVIESVQKDAILGTLVKEIRQKRPEYRRKITIPMYILRAGFESDVMKRKYGSSAPLWRVVLDDVQSLIYEGKEDFWRLFTRLDFILSELGAKIRYYSGKNENDQPIFTVSSDTCCWNYDYSARSIPCILAFIEAMLADGDELRKDDDFIVEFCERIVPDFVASGGQAIRLNNSCIILHIERYDCSQMFEFDARNDVQYRIAMWLISVWMQYNPEQVDFSS